jgi:Ca2+-binding EF-hand superfamily protein
MGAVCCSGAANVDKTYEADLDGSGLGTDFTKTFGDVIVACGMTQIPVTKCLAAFKAKTTKGALSKQAFTAAYEELLTSNDMDKPTEEFSSTVFQLFDKDGNGTVDAMELVCGVALLCGGTEEEKMQAVFNAFDENSDGYISPEEMKTSLLAALSAAQMRRHLDISGPLEDYE